MHALIISHFIRRELQRSFYAYETTSPVPGRSCREGKYSIVIRLRAQMSRSTTKSTQWHVCPANYIISLGKSDKCEDSDQTGWMLRLILFLSGCTDHLVDFATLQPICVFH